MDKTKKRVNLRNHFYSCVLRIILTRINSLLSFFIFFYIYDQCAPCCAKLSKSMIKAIRVWKKNSTCRHLSALIINLSLVFSVENEIERKQEKTFQLSWWLFIDLISDFLLFSSWCSCSFAYFWFSELLMELKFSKIGRKNSIKTQTNIKVDTSTKIANSLRSFSWKICAIFKIKGNLRSEIFFEHFYIFFFGSDEIPAHF